MERLADSFSRRFSLLAGPGRALLISSLAGLGTIAFVAGIRAGSQEDAAMPSSLIAPGAILEKVAGDFAFTEGPTPDPEGNVFFTDQPNDRILRWSVDGELSTFLSPSGRSNGLYFDPQGRLLACADEKNQLWRIGPDKRIEVLVRDYEGRLLNGPNDVWAHPNGDIYFTDPYYERPYWQRNQPQLEVEGVYRLSADGRTLERVIDDLLKPNGIVGTPDGRHLFVADIRGGKTYRYPILENGRLGKAELFCEMGSDGMTLDEQGNLYLTGQGVTVFNSSGEKLGNIPVPERWTANVCFGGPNYDELFITASTGLYRLRMQVRGAAPPPSK